MRVIPTITMITNRENLDLLRQMFIGLDFALLPSIPLKSVYHGRLPIRKSYCELTQCGTWFLTPGGHGCWGDW